MRSRPLSIDPFTGTWQTWHEDYDNNVTIETKQDVTDIVEHNKRLHNAATDARWKGHFHKVATVPNSVLLELQEKGILRDPKALKKWLNDPDNAAFRTRPGRV